MRQKKKSKLNLNMRSFNFLPLIAISMIFFSCGSDNYTPKPRGFFRIDMPKKDYTVYDSLSTYRFEYPSYAMVTPDFRAPEQKNWITIEYPQFKGSLHISYKSVDNNLGVYLEDAHTMLMKHLSKASAIQDSLISNPEHRVYGLLYTIQGKGVASPVQFFMTDSTHHFIRGALYFNIRPNNDSLSPVINFLMEDIRHFIGTTEWKSTEK